MAEVDKIKCDKCSQMYFPWQMFWDTKSTPLCFCKACHRERKRYGIENHE